MPESSFSYTSGVRGFPHQHLRHPDQLAQDRFQRARWRQAIQGCPAHAQIRQARVPLVLDCIACASSFNLMCPASDHLRSVASATNLLPGGYAHSARQRETQSPWFRSTQPGCRITESSFQSKLIGLQPEGVLGAFPIVDAAIRRSQQTRLHAKNDDGADL